MRKKLKFCDACHCYVAHQIYPSIGCVVTRCMSCGRISKATGSFVQRERV